MDDEQTTDPTGMARPARLRTLGASGGGFDSGTIGYDGAGNMTSIGQDLIRYDALSRVIAADVTLGADAAAILIPFATGGGLAVQLGDNVASSAAGIAKLRGAVKKGFLGANARNVRTIKSGRLKGFTRADTNLPGGKKAAADLFESLSGRKPEGNFERVVLKDQGLEVVFRVDGDKVKLDITNLGLESLEKITFLPE